MTNSEPNPQPTIRRISWIVWGALVIVILLLLSVFSRAWQVNQALQGKLATLQPMVTVALAHQATLQVELTRVQSDEYVAEWAQVHAGMTQDGETLVIPVYPTATPTPLPTPAPLPTPTPTPGPFWQQWWNALWGR